MRLAFAGDDALIVANGIVRSIEPARKYKMSGGYIRNSALRDAFLAATEPSPLRQEPSGA